MEQSFLKVLEMTLDYVERNNNFNEVFIIGTTFSGTVLAIFFTLLALPLQNILSRYSQVLIHRVNKDPIYIGSFLFLILVFIVNLFFSAMGASRGLVFLSLTLTIGSVLVLALLVAHTFYFLDVRNQLNDISNEVRRQIKWRIKLAEIMPIGRLVNFMKTFLEP